jgi:two-component system OmpR family sensor kinase
VTGERLTRGELGWLLAQEARGAASALRAEVKELRNSLRPPPPPSASQVRISERDSMSPQEDRISSLPGERHLNALDEAITLLATLQQQTSHRPKRRGRIDLAALLYDLAPNIKLSIEPGAGTEVIGDEHELRRMFHLLLNQSLGGSGEGTTLHTIDLRRQNQWIHISVELGPDTSATSDLERRWLSRMALKHGGHLELRGRRQVVILPAETSNQEEVDQLKRELQQAQLLGEAYAKELATALATEPLTSPPESAVPFVPSAGYWSDPIRALARALLPTLQSVTRTSPTSPAIEALEGWVRQLSLVTQEDDTSLRLDVSQMVTLALETASHAAVKRNIRLVDSSKPESGPVRINAPTQTLSSLLALLLEHALIATPTGGVVTLGVAQESGRVLIRVTDAGAAVPETMSSGLVHGSIDPRSLGRPAGATLLLAGALAERMGAHLQLSTETEHTVVSVMFS